MDFLLPADIVKGATLRGNEYGWQIPAFPEALARAKSHGLACLGGQFQFRVPNGIYEMYWLSADSTERRIGEAWRDYSERSCSEVLGKFESLVSKTDFAKEAANWRLDASAAETLVFVAFFITESESAELSDTKKQVVQARFPMLVDSHAHLDGKQFDSDREQVIARAREAGVRNIVAIGNGDGPAQVDCGIRLAEKYDFIYATLGIHPHEARLANEAAYEKMAQLAEHSKVIAWGEIGLDYYYDHSPRDMQREVFLRQMELASAAKLPIVIHCRPSDNSDNAWEDCLTLISRHWAPRALGGILHCFTGNWPQAKRALDMGFMISFAGNMTFPKAQQIRDAALEVPLDRILIETDSPYLAPVPHRGQRNEPAFVVETARKLAELRGLSVADIGGRTSRNFYEFFKLTETAESKVSAH